MLLSAQCQSLNRVLKLGRKIVCKDISNKDENDGLNKLKYMMSIFFFFFLRWISLEVKLFIAPPPYIDETLTSPSVGLVQGVSGFIIFKMTGSYAQSLSMKPNKWTNKQNQQ